MATHHLLLYLCTLLIASLVSAAEPCTGVYKVVASNLAGFPPAQAFCSTKFPLTASTTTITASTKRTVTSTVATSTVTVTAATATSTSTAPSVTSTTTVSTVTTTVVVSTQTAQTTTTEIQTATATTTFTSYIALKKRGQPTSTVPQDPKSSVFSSVLAQASTYIGSVCTCLETRSTVTSTSTPITVTSVTATSTRGVTQTITVTVTPTVTSFVTATSTVPITSTTTSTTTVLTTTTTTVGPTTTPPPRGPSCSDTQSENPGAGGCSPNCFCESRSTNPGVPGICADAQECLNQCNTDGDCPVGQACAKGGLIGNVCGSSCVPYTDCKSSYQTGPRRRFARDFMELVARGAAVQKAKRADGEITRAREALRREKEEREKSGAQ